MKRLLVIAILVLPFVSFAQWQADMVNRINSDSEKSYHVHSDLQQYRYDFTDEGMQGAVIVIPDENTSAILMLNEKKVHYTPSNGFISVTNDPVQAYYSYKEQGTEKTEGTETVAGYNCVRKSIYDKQGTLMFTMWFSEELNFPLKMKGHWDDNTYMYLENIRQWQPDRSIFKVPSGFVEVDKNLEPVK